MKNIEDNFTGNRSLRKQALADQEMSDRKNQEQCMKMKKRAIPPVPVAGNEKERELTGSLTPSKSKKWKLRPAKELGISPKGKFIKKTPGKSKCSSKEKKEKEKKKSPD